MVPIVSFITYSRMTLYDGSGGCTCSSFAIALSCSPMWVPTKRGNSLAFYIFLIIVWVTCDGYIHGIWTGA